jgi:hypothetical protein
MKAQKLEYISIGSRNIDGIIPGMATGHDDFSNWNFGTGSKWSFEWSEWFF